MRYASLRRQGRSGRSGPDLNLAQSAQLQRTVREKAVSLTNTVWCKIELPHSVPGQVELGIGFMTDI